MAFDKTIGLAAVAICLAAAGCSAESEAPAASQEQVARACSAIEDTPVQLEGGTFAMGQAEVYPEEGPVRQTTVDAFWIDPHEVTNRQFAQFVDATDYVTLAEKPVDPAAFGVPEAQIPPELLLPGSAVFTPPERPSNSYSDWWKYVPGANWKRPYGPNGPEAKGDEPVVHLGWDDMQAYARWKGGRMPTEAEWEYAASAGQPATTDQPEEANSWQGVFPAVNQETDGFKGIAPVGCYAPNSNGLYDMVGNVWEVTADLFRPGHDPADTDNPRGPSENQAYDPLNPGYPSRVMKGGSYLCAPNYCQRYRPAARQGRDPGMGASNVGFRLAYDTPPA
ncbi:formylglycine-generating enzyme family protein [Aurantiacibacter rhizosphaerae]|uniref:SUMF1/EgtB/PvdO family nonheme iron enzyme n=1 Tax=Aurantiacibacter rhizosphaerae TaxID=2691582 RepID=A0A844XHT2_9SPHN|nr:formylglycine-generating enzyme family protein [Aurantiacibacter rhizosphaerae]MWV29108.1 SUMF1/EgtB/PvdO family nonheme iron enzyme [Aurantiacibacter rhizosphaerae]